MSADIEWKTQYRNTKRLEAYKNIGKVNLTDYEAAFYTQENIRDLSNTISKALTGVHPEGKKIVVNNDVIVGILQSQIDRYRYPRVGDMYSKYQVMFSDPVDPFVDINCRVVEYITNQIRNEFEMVENNKKLTIWDTLLGDFNDKGLRSHSTIKLRERRPDSFQFHMRY
jgi:hypothetical protein